MFFLQRFWLLTGESESTLAEGLTVTASVVRVTPAIIICRLASGLRGILPSRLSEAHNPDHLRDLSRDEQLDVLMQRVPIGSTRTCRVARILYDQFEVELTDRRDDVRLMEPGPMAAMQDQYFEKRSAEEQRIREAEKQALRAQADKHRFLPRAIQHPMFRNCSSTDAQTDLKSQPPGAWLVRPSTRGADHLTLTWKLTDDIVIHVDIVELNKPTHESLGRTLVVNQAASGGAPASSLKFEDLDHLMAEYVQPMNRLVQSLLVHDKFVHGGEKEVLEVLTERQRAEPSRTQYALWIDRDAHVRISFLRRDRESRLFNEAVGLTPAGFVFRNQSLRTPAHIIAAFKSSFAADASKSSSSSSSSAAQRKSVSAPAVRDPRAAAAPPMAAANSVPIHPLPAYAPPPISAASAPYFPPYGAPPPLAPPPAYPPPAYPPFGAYPPPPGPAMMDMVDPYFDRRGPPPPPLPSAAPPAYSAPRPHPEREMLRSGGDARDYRDPRDSRGGDARDGRDGGRVSRFSDRDSYRSSHRDDYNCTTSANLFSFLFDLSSNS